MRQMRQQSQAQIEAVLRPDQKAKFEALRASGGGGGPGFGGGHAGGYGGASFGGGETQEPAARGGGAPIGDLPQRSLGTPAAGPRGTLSGPDAAATAAEPETPSAGGRGGGPQAMLDRLNLDATQQAKAQSIFAAARDKGRAARETGDMEGARAARQDAMRQLDAILRPDQRAKLAAARARMRQDGGEGGGPGGGL